MQLSDFHFDLPPSRIALEPVRPRDSAQLLVAQGDTLSDKKVLDLPALLRSGDHLVINNSAVMPARLVARTDEGKRVEVLLCEPVENQKDGQHWRVLMRGKAKKIIFNDDIFATPTNEAGVLRFNVSQRKLQAFVEAEGTMPLPPYIAGRREVAPRDAENYQTIYSQKQKGWSSIAAPTAGLHFTDRLLKALGEKSIQVSKLTLHVGAGTFLPIKATNIADHKMLAERAFLSQPTAKKLNETKEQGGRIIAVGTTSLRVLESAVDEEGRLHAFENSTDLFIYPGFSFRAIDGMLTNFHLPASTPLLLVSALMGVERTRAIYHHALTGDYRFFSYGDACLLLPQ